ncbi:hypothetical protein ACFLX3_05075 [Chloroflexota bacterium]
MKRLLTKALHIANATYGKMIPSDEVAQRMAEKYIAPFKVYFS